MQGVGEWIAYVAGKTQPGPHGPAMIRVTGYKQHYKCRASFVTACITGHLRFFRLQAHMCMLWLRIWGGNALGWGGCLCVSSRFFCSFSRYSNHYRPPPLLYPSMQICWRPLGPRYALTTEGRVLPSFSTKRRVPTINLTKRAKERGFVTCSSYSSPNTGHFHIYYVSLSWAINAGRTVRLLENTQESLFGLGLAEIQRGSIRVSRNNIPCERVEPVSYIHPVYLELAWVTGHRAAAEP